MRLITRANCVPCEAQFGVEPLTTSEAMETPKEHWQYELAELPAFEARGAARSMPWEEDDDTFKAFRARLPEKVTPEAIYERIALPLLQAPADAPQRSEAWHLSRAFAVTASQFASASNENPNMSARKLLEAKTFPKKHGFQGNSFTEWGSIHEVHAEEAFISFLNKAKNTSSTKASNGDWEFSDGSKLTHISHHRNSSQPFLGFSPDALLWSADASEVSLVEYKCPAFRRSGPGHPYAGKNDLCVPRQYMPQLQGSMQLLREAYPEKECVRAWFVVWQAHQFFVTHVPFVPRFASKIVQASSSFFKDQFLPACADAVTQREATLPALWATASQDEPSAGQRRSPLEPDCQ